MCGRFALSVTAEKLIEFFGLDECADFVANLNITPGTDIPVIRHSPEGKRVLHLLSWGLLPHWVKNPETANRPINARIETLSEKPYFRDAYHKRRCLIPAEAFYEWKRDGKAKQPYRFTPNKEAIMAFAGLWESWKAPDGEVLRTVCIVTTVANDVMKPVHDRMPVILAEDSWAAWLEGPVEAALAHSPCALSAEPIDKIGEPPLRQLKML
ncbi:SOS response-associated peptidase [Propionivibrio dicarboxylicus]|uniref:Abasic site processing protein n=1 Tax=Propionivibrio dicarboxylicus TaxID=83767 RepID=A0A1G8F2U0_9RHOO|nr:SOS response-associated peptidase [Propionivibrio dicarboxylicus]SDH76431.1 Putative SOS response-associated peptidase YedK [Propionivibrio dicarboxylicus]